MKTGKESLPELHSILSEYGLVYNVEIIDKKATVFNPHSNIDLNVVLSVLSKHDMNLIYCPPIRAYVIHRDIYSKSWCK